MAPTPGSRASMYGWRNIVLDRQLSDAARDLDGHEAKKGAVSAVPSEHVKRGKQLDIIAMFGKIDFDPKYNYKVERRRKRR